MGEKFSYAFVAHDLFGLKPNIMKLYPRQKLTIVQLIFNCRLSRARRDTENGFGIMVSMFRIYRRPINVEKVVKVTKACVALYNFLIKINNATLSIYCPANYLDTNGLQGKDAMIGEGRKVFRLHLSHLMALG